MRMENSETIQTQPFLFYAAVQQVIGARSVVRVGLNTKPVAGKVILANNCWACDVNGKRTPPVAVYNIKEEQRSARPASSLGIHTPEKAWGCPKPR